ncbi:leukocyte-associated immunoglobulin-like receptor 1 isoform X1 [Grammomys surdaster]|uniref:leukocyte-associated immunoglobulin-like receptor 1 isoform X1 n=1 Tax=Grammomys surdaster TaxID=491861 RepID=UPI00109FCC8F|nr:leukocyte-associated immunoglobulin-like receptor 1 isoform X1 [Grammomys surdaster]
MSLHPVIVLVLVLCLGWKINTQDGSLSDITICAEPGPVIFQGSFVTVVCSKSGNYDKVRLEKDGNTFMEKDSEPSMREDRFHIGPVNKTITGHYHCIYRNENTWSNRSEKLELKVTKEHVTQVPSPGPTMTSDPSIICHDNKPFWNQGLLRVIGACHHQSLQATGTIDLIPPVGPVTACGSLPRTPPLQRPLNFSPQPDTSWPKAYSIYILTVASVIFLLCLSFFLFCFLSHRQKKQGLPQNKRQQQSPQERLSLANNGLEMTPDIVADDRLPEDRQTEIWTPVAGDLQEVTYAQLDHHSLTQRAVGAVTPQSTDIMTESSTYAAIIRP